MKLADLAKAATPAPWGRIGQRALSIPEQRTVADLRYINGVNDARYVVALVNTAEARQAVVDAAREIAANWFKGADVKPLDNALAALDAAEAKL